MRNGLQDRLRSITSILEHEGSEHSTAFCKMAPFILNIVIRVAKQTGSSEEDILSEVLCAFSAARELYQGVLYKYQGSLYKCAALEENRVLLETPRSNKRYRKVWADLSEVVEVRKAEFYSFLYRKIQQQCTDILRSSQCEKRSVGSKPVELDLYEEDGLVLQSHLSSNPEALFSAAQLYHEIVPQISPQARTVFDLFIDGVFSDDVWLASYLKVSRRSIRAAKIEILRAYYRLERSLMQDPSLCPIYMKASEL